MERGTFTPRPRKHRVLLGALLLNANTALSTSLLIECLWEDSPPRSARANLHAYVTQLRRQLHDPRGSARLSTVPDGYLLHVEPGELDAEEFERLAADGQLALGAGEPAVAAARLGRALGLWRGDLLAGTDLPAPLRPAAIRLQELRLTVTEDRVEALLRGDKAADPVADLLRLSEVHPLRERFQAQLMQALYRTGRSSEALAVFRRFRLRLIDDLGVEPGPELQRLHQRILVDDPGLRCRPGTGDAAVATPRKPDAAPQAVVAAPRTLPADVPDFVGRDDLLLRMDGVLTDRGSPAVLVLAGIAGAGKTALAVHWAHRAATRFPDGQIYVDLRGWSAGPPTPPLIALTFCLRLLGLPAALMPADLDDAIAAYRTLLAGRRLLLVLDNARTAEQVRPLLPAGDTCVTLVTSRDRLTGLVALNHAARLTVSPLTRDAAVALLRSALKHRSDDAALSALAESCGRLPLALRVASAKCADRSEGDPATDAPALVAHGALAALDVHDDPAASVRSSFAASYRLLPASQRRLFRLLGLVPGDVTAEAAAALLDADPATAGGALDALAAVHLLEVRHGGRYALHVLLREYARDEGHRTDPQRVRDAAYRRLADMYLAGMEGAARLLAGYATRVQPDPDRPAAPTWVFADATAARRWLDAELPAVTAVLRHPVPRDTPHATRPSADDGPGSVRLHRPPAGHRAAESTAGEQAGVAAALAPLPGEHGGPDDSLCLLDLLDDMVRVNRRLGRRRGEAVALGGLGALRFQRGELRRSVVDLEAALRIFRDTGCVGGQASALVGLGITHVYLGRHDRARTLLDDGLRAYEWIADPVGLALGRHGLATLHSEAGDHRRAVRHATAAVELAGGDARLHGVCSVELALARHRAGIGSGTGLDRIARWTRASGAEVVTHAQVATLVALARAALTVARPGPALTSAREAVALARRGGYRLLEGEAQRVLAETFLATGDHPAAVTAARAAAAELAATGYRLGEQRARELLTRLGVSSSAT